MGSYSLGFALFVVLYFLLSVGVAHAHIRMKPVANGLVPRSNSDGLKAAPCGGVARTANPVTFEPGQTITVNWDETINHPGRFEIYFSAANDTNWTMLKMIPDTTDNGGDTPHPYTTTVTLPSTPCTACTLQLIQVMTENPNLPSLYYSCADLKIQAATTAPPPAPLPIPPPGPVPVSNPCE